MKGIEQTFSAEDLNTFKINDGKDIKLRLGHGYHIYLIGETEKSPDCEDNSLVVYGFNGVIFMPRFYENLEVDITGKNIEGKLTHGGKINIGSGKLDLEVKPQTLIHVNKHHGLKNPNGSIYSVPLSESNYFDPGVDFERKYRSTLGDNITDFVRELGQKIMGVPRLDIFYQNGAEINIKEFNK